MSFTDQQMFAISTAERLCATISLVGTSIIIVTFLGSKSFRKPVNRLAFYASWGNILSNTGQLIADSGINHGVRSSLCQFQGCLLQWSVQSDAYWTFAMACNVYLTFYHKYEAVQLRKLEWKYLVFCYGLPCIPAIIFLFIETEERGKVYGSGLLWCWIAVPWDFLRMATFYCPVWFTIILTVLIYIRTGREIFANRRLLRQVPDSTNTYTATTLDGDDSWKMTEIQVTNEALPEAHLHSSHSGVQDLSPHHSLQGEFTAYSVNIKSEIRTNSDQLQPQNVASLTTTTNKRHVAARKDVATWVYTKCAMLYFIALIITWVPSTVNRVNSIVHPKEMNFALNIIAAIVLPLQGFWNSLIYISISWRSFKKIFRDWKQWYQQHTSFQQQRSHFSILTASHNPNDNGSTQGFAHATGK